MAPELETATPGQAPPPPAPADKGEVTPQETGKSEPGFTPLLTQRSKPKEETPSEPFTSVDVSKLSADVQSAYKLMQADYTRKTQSVAEQRKQFEEQQKEFQSRQDRFLEILAAQRGQQPQAQPTPTGPTIQERINELVANGDTEGAIALSLQNAREEAQAEIAPLKTEAQVSQMRSEFRDIVTGLNMNDPLIKKYGRAVAETFDSPGFESIRREVLSSPEKMRQFVPFVMRGIAAYQHAETLEANYAKAVEEGVKKALESERGKLKGVPPKLVRTGTESLEPTGSRMTRKQAIDLSMRQLTGSES